MSELLVLPVSVMTELLVVSVCVMSELLSYSLRIQITNFYTMTCNSVGKTMCLFLKRIRNTERKVQARNWAQRSGTRDTASHIRA
jgi:hypothetical protein